MSKFFRMIFALILSWILIFPNLSAIRAEHSNNEKNTNTLIEPFSVAAAQSLPATRLQVTVEPSTTISPDTTRACRGQLPAWYFTVTITEIAGVGATVTNYGYQFFNSNGVALQPILLNDVDFARDFNAFGGGVGRIRPFETKRGNLCISFNTNLGAANQGFTGYVSFSGRDDNNNSFCGNTSLLTLLRSQSSQSADLSVTNSAPETAVNLSRTFLHTIKVTNNGPQIANNVLLTDSMELGATFQAIASDREDLTFSTPPIGSTGEIRCLIDSLPANTSITVWLFVKNQNISNSTNVAVISSSTPDSIPENNIAIGDVGTPSNSSAKSGRIRLTTVLNSISTALGTRLAYTTTVTNIGTDSADYSLANILPKETSFAGLNTDNQKAFSIYSPPIGGTGVVLSGYHLSPNESATFTITLNVLKGSSFLLGDAAKSFLFQGFSTPSLVVPTAIIPRCVINLISSGIPPTDDERGGGANGVISVSGGGTITLNWGIALPSFGDPTPAPRFSAAAFNSDGNTVEERLDSSLQTGITVEPHADPCKLVGYKLYISQTSDVDVSEGNVWKRLPADALGTNAPFAPGGSYYRLRAIYLCPDGTTKDSEPSNTVSAGVGTSSCTLTCAANQTVSATSSAGVVVNYTPPTTNGSCGTITCTPPSGSTFPIGSTPITCTSSVGNGRCTFNVTVNQASSGLRINAVRREGKNLIIEGTGFTDGAKILKNDEQLKTIYDTSSSLIGKKAGKSTVAGDRIQVRNPDGSLSNVVIYQP